MQDESYEAVHVTNSHKKLNVWDDLNKNTSWNPLCIFLEAKIANAAVHQWLDFS